MKKGKLLIVEDSDLVLESYTSSFEYEGYTVYSYLTGDEALKAIRRGV